PSGAGEIASAPGPPGGSRNCDADFGTSPTPAVAIWIDQYESELGRAANATRVPYSLAAMAGVPTSPIDLREPRLLFRSPFSSSSPTITSPLGPPRRNVTA